MKKITNEEVKKYFKGVGYRLLYIGFILLCIFLMFGVGSIVLAVTLPLWPFTYLFLGEPAPYIAHYFEWEFEWMEKTSRKINEKI